MSLEKKAKESHIARTEQFTGRIPETHEDDLPCFFKVSFPFSALLSLGLLSCFNSMWAGLLSKQGYGAFSASDVSVIGEV